MVAKKISFIPKDSEKEAGLSDAGPVGMNKCPSTLLILLFGVIREFPYSPYSPLYSSDFYCF
jgi:hypothetical protein